MWVIVQMAIGILALIVGPALLILLILVLALLIPAWFDTLVGKLKYFRIKTPVETEAGTFHFRVRYKLKGEWTMEVESPLAYEGKVSLNIPHCEVGPDLSQAARVPAILDQLPKLIDQCQGDPTFAEYACVLLEVEVQSHPDHDLTLNFSGEGQMGAYAYFRDGVSLGELVLH